jgi:hypothetical protein
VRIYWLTLLVNIALAACGSSAQNAEAPESATSTAPTPSATPPPQAQGAPPLDCSIFEKIRKGDFSTTPPQDPGTFWLAFEQCHAAGKPHCERAWLLLVAMPSMASPTEEELERQRNDYVRGCQTLPEPVQRCLTAHAIAHPAECEGLHAREKLDQVLRSGRQ